MTESASRAINVIKDVTSKESTTQSETCKHEATKQDSQSTENNLPETTKDNASLEEPGLSKQDKLPETTKDDALPGPSTQDSRQESDMEKASSNIIPPTIIQQSPVKPSPLTLRDKDQIKKLFASEIEKGGTQQLKTVRNKMCTTIVL